MSDRVSSRTLSDLVTGKQRASFGTGLARATLGQGLGMGWGDEAEAWLRSKLGSEDYETLVKQIRAEQAQFDKDYPFTSGAAEFVGGAAPGVAAMLIPGMQPLGANQLARSTAGALGRLALTGGVTGTISGAGAANDGDRLAGAGWGGALGAAVGVATPTVIRTAGAGGRWLKDKLFPSEKSITNRAADKLNKAVADAEMQPSDITRQMNRDRALGAPSVVANTDPALAALAETVAQRSGKGARKIERQLERQTQGTRERTYQNVKKGLNGGNYYAEEESMVKGLRAKANNVYENAYAHGDVDDPRIVEAMKDPRFQKAWNEARAIADTEALAAKLRGEDPSKFALPEIYKPSGKFNSDGSEILELVKLPDVRSLDYVKRGIDALVDKGYKGNSLSKAEANALKDLRREFVNAIDENVPAYKAARGVYAGDMEVLDALRTGYNDFGKMDHEEIVKLVSTMTGSEKEAFRTGVTRELYGRIMNNSGNRNVAANIITSPEMQAKLQPLFDSASQFRLFRAALEREAQLVKESQRILGGSQTGKRTQMRADFESDSGVGEAAAATLTGGPKSGLMAMVNRFLTNGSINDQTADKLADMLMSRDPRQVAAVVKLLEDRAAELAPKVQRAGMTESGITTGITTSAWPNTTQEDGPAPDIDADIKANNGLPAGLPPGPDIDADLRERERRNAPPTQ